MINQRYHPGHKKRIYLDRFIMEQKSCPLTNFLIPALDRFALKKELNLSPGLEKYNFDNLCNLVRFKMSPAANKWV